MAARKKKPIEDRDPYARAVLDAFDDIADANSDGLIAVAFTAGEAKGYANCARCWKHCAAEAAQRRIEGREADRRSVPLE